MSFLLNRKMKRMVQERAVEFMPPEMKEKAKTHHVVPFIMPKMQHDLGTLQTALGRQGIGYDVQKYNTSLMGLVKGEVHFLCIPEDKLSKTRLDEILEETGLTSSK